MHFSRGHPLPCLKDNGSGSGRRRRSPGFVDIAVCLALLLTVFAACAHDEDEEPIENASTLRAWCKEESAAYFAAQGETPYNWSASWHEEGNLLIVEGEWLVGHTPAAVSCRVMKGARRKDAVYEIR
jgi:hypothetical protein